MISIYWFAISLIFLVSYLIFRRSPRGNPLLGALFFNGIMAIGILRLADMDIEADVAHANLLLFTSIAFVLGSIAFHAGKTDTRRLYAWHFKNPIQSNLSRASRSAITLLLFLSIIVSIVYFTQIGYILIIDAARDFMSGSVGENFATRRLAAYASDERYFAPGYVNQFKNTIVPFCVGLIFAHHKLQRGKIHRSMILLIPLVAIFLLGTGQKGALLQTGIAYMFVYSLARSSKKISRNAKLAVLGLMVLFGVASILQGRADADFTMEGIVSVTESMTHRIFQANQISAIVGFRYIYDIPVTWGQEWASALVGILPGYRGSDLANVIYSMLFGSERGTAPPSIWGSTYHNFGFVGTVLFAFCYGGLMNYGYRRFLSGERSLIRCFCYGYLFALFSMWIAGGPVFLLNNGVLTICILRLILKTTEKKRYYRTRPMEAR